MDKYKDVEGEIELKDLPKLEEQLKPEQNGRDTGMKETPKSDSDSQSGHENMIKGAYDRTVGRAYGHYSKIVQTLIAKIAEIVRTTTDPQFEDQINNAKQTAVEAKLRYDIDAKKSSMDKEKASKKLASLTDEGIDTAGSSSKNAVYHIFTYVSILLIFESLLNSHFLGQGSMYGLVGGFIEAALISLLSILTSFVIGIVVKYIYDTNWWGRKISVGIGIAYVASIFVYHSIIGWYRHCLVYKNADTAVFDALANFHEHGPSLPEIYSYGLMIVGLLFAFIAFYHGTRYKNALQLSKNAKIIDEYYVAHGNLSNVYQKYLNTISEENSKQLNAIDDIVRSVVEGIGYLNLNVIEIWSIMDKYEGLTEAIKSSYTNTIGKFRKSNEAVRRTPVPPYFTEKAEELAVKNFSKVIEGLEPANEIINNVKIVKSQIQENANTAKANIRTSHEDSLKFVPVPN